MLVLVARGLTPESSATRTILSFNELLMRIHEVFVNTVHLPLAVSVLRRVQVS